MEIILDRLPNQFMMVILSTRSDWPGRLIRPTKGYNLKGSIFGELDIWNGLKFKSTFGLEANLWDSRSWSPKFQWDSSKNENSYLEQQYNKSLTWVWDNTFTYEKNLDKHHINVMAGTSAQENRYNFMNGSVQNFASDQTQQLSNGTLQPTLEATLQVGHCFSYMGRMNYAFADKYLATRNSSPGWFVPLWRW